VESDDSDLDEEEMAMISRKLKKFFKKVGGNLKKESTIKPRSSDRDQFSDCFKCGKTGSHREELAHAEGRTGIRTISKSWQPGVKLRTKRVLKKKTKRQWPSWLEVNLNQTLNRSKACPNSRIRYVVLAKLKL